MKIKKIAHSCLVIEVSGRRILTDPGSFSTEQNALTGIDAVIITHEHADHFHAESVQAIVKNNPTAVIITNSSVGKKLTELGIPFTLLEGASGGASSSMDFGGLAIEAFDAKHEEIFEDIGQVQNTAYILGGDQLMLPGDAYAVPPTGKSVAVVPIPFGAPWSRVPDALHYILKVQPKQTFIVHDFMIKPGVTAFVGNIMTSVLGAKQINFVAMNDGDEKEF